MTPPHRTLVVIPALNEEATIGAVVERVRSDVEGVDVLVVDDGSSDRTEARARAAGATVARLPYNLGVGGALRVGYRYAWSWGYERVVQLDADGQHDPTEVQLLLDALDDADIVVGARFAGRGEFDVSRIRRFGMWMLARRVSRVAGTTLTDVTSGFRAVDGSVIGFFARTYPVEYIGATVEALIIAARSGFRIRQVPVVMNAREGGTPSHGFIRASIYVLRALAVIALSRLQRWPHPAVDADPDVVLPQAQEGS